MRSGPRFVQLSEQFIDSLKAFFDSVDVERHGFVSFESICHRWQQFPPRLTDVLPFNFLDCLARTVPPNGLITFERFLAGVRIAIAEQRQGRRGEMKRVQSDGGGLYQPPEVVPYHYDDLDGDAEQVAANYAHARCPIMGTTSHHRQSVPAIPSSASESPAHFDYSEASETPIQVSMRTRKQHRGPGAIFNSSQFRPISAHSSSTSTSSSMAEIRWRDSRMSNNSTPLGDTNNNLVASATANAANNNRHSNYLPEHTPQVAKHEKLLEEELDIMQKGSEAAQKLLTWYQERLTSLERRRALLDKGMVALDSAVHEQKLNFVRAQVTEMTRRISALLVSNEKGFPNHSNLIRNAVPASTAPSSTTASGSGGSNTTTASSGCSTPDANGNGAAATGQAWLQVQNARLAEELEAKSRLIEQLQREKMFYDQTNYVPAKLYANPNAAIYTPIRATPTAYVRPAHIVRHAIGAHGLPSPVKRHDTLL